MSVLNKKEILKRLKSDDSNQRLIITPILDEKNQLDGPGVDLRLSNQFTIFRMENISHINVGDTREFKIGKVQREVVIPFGKTLILHPKTLVLGSTLEYVAMPKDLVGTLEGRSSWARLGLLIATACAIDPGFKGCITLELSNLGNLPLYLIPGIRLAKLILSPTTSASNYSKKRKYFSQIGPEFSKASQDKDLKIFYPRKKKDSN
jgi:deoxycytidine triphosphate deaminase